MPFIIQCPYADCAKFMLLEDSDRGSTVKCLCCKRSIKLDPSKSEESSSAPASTSTPAATRQNVRACPQCNTPLKVPAGAQNQRIRCPKCNYVF